MTVPSSPVPKPLNEMEVCEGNQKEEVGQKQKLKRSKDPGVRVIGGRIYDPQNGKSCHQCRQKTLDFTARCKNVKKGKQCTIRFCLKCLLNRYGERAEEMEALDDWLCPKCRDICNCSFCRKKKGHQPTGIMVHAAKATGFSSVSELLQGRGSDVSQEVITKGQENACDGTHNTNSNSGPLDSSVDEKAKKTKGEMLKDQVEVPDADVAGSRPQKDNEDTVLRRSPWETSSLPNEVTREEEKKDDEKARALRGSPRKSDIPEEFPKREEKMDADTSGAPSVAVVAETEKRKKSKVLAEGKGKSNKLNTDMDTSDDLLDVAFPPGTLLRNVAGIDLVPEDVGYALQFLEFCSAFGEVLGISNGQPESVLRDIFSGLRPRVKNSSAVQFFDQLLSFMFKDREEEEESSSCPADGETAWIDSLNRCLSESELELEDLPEGWLNKGYAGYEMLESSQKLRLLTFLCDEMLSTADMRKWMEDQNSKFIEQGKEARENVQSAKEKAKLFKRRMQEETVKALLARNGVPLTASEHDALVSEIKAEANRAQEEMLEAMGLASRNRKRSDAVRTETIVLDDRGRAFWRLKCLGDSSILVQDIGAIEELALNDKWLSFNDEEVKEVDKYISSVRVKKHRRNKLAEKSMMKTSGSDAGQTSSSTEDSPCSADNN